MYLHLFFFFLELHCYARELYRNVFLRSMYQYIYQCMIPSHVMILFQSCPVHFIGIAGAPVLNVPRTGSNSCLRATRRKCARISFLVQSVFPRDTFTTLILVILFSPASPSPFLTLLSFFLTVPRLIISRVLSFPITLQNVSNANHACISTVFIVPTKLFSCTTRAVCALFN